MHRALLIASLIAVAPLAAHADPLEVHASAAEDAPRFLVAPGVTLAYVNGHATAGPSIEVGARFARFFVLRGEAFTGTNAFVSNPGTLQMVTAGVDATTCENVQRVCLYGGFAAGYEHDTRVDGWTGEDMTVSRQGPQGLVRAGVDVGGKRVRVRYGLESSLFFGQIDAAMQTSVAFRF